jgi:hypothetical protein
MAISYAQARDIVLAEVPPQWTLGTFYMDESTITEDDEVFVFTVGPRELLIDGDEDYERDGSSLPVVSKEDGRLEWLTWPFLLINRPELEARPNPDASNNGDA